MRLRLLFLAILPFVLVGCPERDEIVNKPTTPLGSGDAAKTAGEAANDAQAAAGTAQKALDSAEAERLGRVASDSDAATKAVEEGRTGDAKGALRAQQGHLEGVDRNAEEAAELARAEALRAEGRILEADATINGLVTAAKTDAIERAELVRARDDALKAASEARAAADAANLAFAKQAEEFGRKQAKAIEQALADAKKAEEELRNGERSKQVAWCNKIGFGALGLAVALMAGAWFLGGIMAVRKMGPVAAFIGFIGLCAFWAARVLGHPWFMPGMTTVIAAVVVWAVLWWRKHEKRGDLAEELAARGAKAKTTLEKLVPTIDAVYREGTQTIEDVVASLKGGTKATVQDLLDAVLFSRLSAKLDTPEKDTVKAVRETTAPISLT